MDNVIVEEKINRWKSQFDEQIQTALNFNSESLMVVEKLLLSKFDNKKQLLEKPNQGFVEACILYIGEVFRRNDKIRKLNWIFSLDAIFPILECPYYSNSWVDVIKKFPILLNKRSGTVIYDYFIKNTNYFKENHKDLFKGTQAIPGKGGYGYQYFILVQEESFQLQEIEQVLKNYYAKKGLGDKVSFHSENHLLVDMSNDYYFHFQLEMSESVLQESKEIAESYKGNKDKTTIASCKSRVEFWGDEDPDGDYFNDHMFILEQIMKNEKLLIYDYRNGVFFDEI